MATKSASRPTVVVRSTNSVRKPAAALKRPVRLSISEKPASRIDPSEDLGKVRDLLFGSQMRDQDRRFAQLDDRLTKEVTSLREEAQKRLDSLEGFLKKEVQALVDRLKGEQSERNEAIKSLTSETRDAAKATDKRLAQLDERLSTQQRDLHEEILEQSKALRDEVRKAHEETTATLQRAVGELRGDKIDRGALAELFAELAVRLRGDEETA